MKTLLYCTKAKPYLYEVDAESGSKYFVENKDYWEDNPKMNGLVCFECECEEAFDISKVVQTNKNLSFKIRDVYDTEEVTLYLYLKTASTLKQI